jgi:KDO2-lipid IV(A) lauroyltransferase
MLEGAISYKAEEKQDKDEKIATLTQCYNDIIERAIKEVPEQWFWMHDRWRM